MLSQRFFDDKTAGTRSSVISFERGGLGSSFQCGSPADRSIAFVGVRRTGPEGLEKDTSGEGVAM